MGVAFVYGVKCNYYKLLKHLDNVSPLNDPIKFRKYALPEHATRMKKDMKKRYPNSHFTVFFTGCSDEAGLNVVIGKEISHMGDDVAVEKVDKSFKDSTPYDDDMFEITPEQLQNTLDDKDVSYGHFQDAYNLKELGKPSFYVVWDRGC